MERILQFDLFISRPPYDILLSFLELHCSFICFVKEYTLKSVSLVKVTEMNLHN